MSERTAPLPPLRSLRARGLLATLALLLYLLGAGIYIAIERGRAADNVELLEGLARHEKALALAEAAVDAALVDISVSGSAAAEAPPHPEELLLYMENCARLFAELESFDGSYARVQRSILRGYEAVREQPVRANWIGLREAMRRARDELDIRHQRLSLERERLVSAYRRHEDAVTIESLLLATLGLAAFGSVAAWFFARLAKDIGRLESHAREIVAGRRGVSLPVRREDELGHLMHAVNRMAVDLDERERQLLLEGERRFHQDKMLAVGALAAGMAHEVNNPLAAISGTAQELRAASVPLPTSQLAASAELILAQAERAATAARHLAEVAAPQPADLAPVDLNGLLHHVVQLMGYDRRYRRFTFDLGLGPSIPAVQTSARAVQQVLMQLLTLICEALATSPAAPPVVRLETRVEDESVVLWMRFATALDFTRADVQRGLLVTRAIVEPLKARLAFGQADGDGQHIKLALPVAGDA